MTYYGLLDPSAPSSSHVTSLPQDGKQLKSKCIWVFTQHSWIPKIKSHHVLHHFTTEHYKAIISPSLWMLFQKAFPLVFILNRTGEEPTVLWNYHCFLDEEHTAVSNTTATASQPGKPGRVHSWSHRRVCFPFYPSQQVKRKYRPATKVKKGVLVWFGLVWSYSSGWQDTKGGQLHLEQVLLLFMWCSEVQRFLSPSSLPENRRIIWNTSS